MGSRSVPDDSLLGHVIDGRYRIDAFVGQGGYGIVCEGMQLSVDRKVAIKLLLPEHANDEEMQQRFAREARLASRIRNVHVVQLVDFGVSGAVPYIVMEWLDGPTLKRLQQDCGRLPWPIAALIARDIARGLSDAHTLGLAHRDMKPSNILLTIANGAVQPVIVDFGLAKTFAKEEMTQEDTLTSANMMLGTPAYMAPETVAGDELDGRGDLYALGILLCEMISGRLPFRGRTQMETATQHLVGKRPDAKFFAGTDTPDEMIALIISMLDREPASRPETAARVAQALDPFAREATRAQIDSLRDAVANAIGTTDTRAGDSGKGQESAVVLDSARHARLTTLFEQRPDPPREGTQDDSLTQGRRPAVAKLDSDEPDPHAVEQQTVAPRDGIERQESPRPAIQPQRGASSSRRSMRGTEHDGQHVPRGAATQRFITIVVTVVIIGAAALLIPRLIRADLERGAEVSATDQTSATANNSDRITLERHAPADNAAAPNIEEPRAQEDDDPTGQPVAQSDDTLDSAALDDSLSEAVGVPVDDHDKHRSPTHAAQVDSVTRESDVAPTAAGAAPSREDERRTIPTASASGSDRAPRSEATQAEEPVPNNAPSSALSVAEATIEADTSMHVAEAEAGTLILEADGSQPGDGGEVIPAAPPIVTIRSRPWAEIFVDGESIGSHSVIRWQPPRRGEFLIRAVNGESSRERRVTVGPRDETTVRFMFVE